MKKLLLAALATVSLAAPLVAGLPAHVAQARPDCQAVDYNHDGVVDISDVAIAASLNGGNGRTNILVAHFGEPC